MSACTSSSGEDFGLITANWSFKDLATNTTITQCPPGTSSADVHAIRLDGAGNETSEVYIDKYNCNDLTGTSDYPIGTYKVFVDIVGYGQSLSAIVDITAQDKTVTVTLVDDGGYFLFDWDLRDAATNAPLTCSEAGNPDSIEITSTLSGTTQAVADKFNCEDGSGVTGALLTGSYTISVAALNASNQALGAPQNFSDRLIGDHNDVTDLGVITLPID
ncbi:MAG TPA: hypothetical protein VFQ53_34455 [Kofleriaceae bacterium]|nr:hypothetical protein [Kofleriaceae bacterium]